jgi:hypothetical protein
MHDTKKKVERKGGTCLLCTVVAEGRDSYTTSHVFTSAGPNGGVVTWPLGSYRIVAEPILRSDGLQHLALGNGRGNLAMLCLVHKRQAGGAEQLQPQLPHGLAGRGDPPPPLRPPAPDHEGETKGRRS